MIQNLLEQRKVIQLVKKFPAKSVEIKGSSPCSQKLINGPHHESAQWNPHYYTMFMTQFTLCFHQQ
jgi:hypothetical protein